MNNSHNPNSPEVGCWRLGSEHQAGQGYGQILCDFLCDTLMVTACCGSPNIRPPTQPSSQAEGQREGFPIALLSPVFSPKPQNLSRLIGQRWVTCIVAAREAGNVSSWHFSASVWEWAFPAGKRHSHPSCAHGSVAVSLFFLPICMELYIVRTLILHLSLCGQYCSIICLFILFTVIFVFSVFKVVKGLSDSSRH